MKLVWTEDIDGEQTTHYRGTPDLERALERLPADAQDEIRMTTQQFQDITDYDAALDFDVPSRNEAVDLRKLAAAQH